MELLTNVPLTIKEIEEWMKEGRKIDVQFPQLKCQATNVCNKKN